ncbi:MAG TPA: prepilin-type N-terminal cleavage/methylation domain-containing protein [Tepidisphaeraceae bacterium]|jgi:prepilin-type N-terminal cleavage/methylation domain-containing protein|nr:prepilin-type N-terminal cleavage/methylation domain-containing protein [Tepidisphaeraceae bacterium]
MAIAKACASEDARKGGFTLVELLVVIGIIGLLISILLPTISKAREQSNRVVCSSNMRELYNEMRIYSAMYNDVCPIGYIQEKAFSYIMNWSNSSSSPPKPSQMGLLVAAGISKNPKAFYCPSEIVDVQFTYQPNPSATVFSANPWPFVTTTGAGTHTRLGFSARPITYWPANAPAPAKAGVSYGTMNSANKLYWLPTDGTGQITLPRFARLRNHAILSDTCYTRPKVLERHKKGVNVLYGNGSARFVTMSSNTFDKSPWNTMDENTAFTLTNNPVFLHDGTYEDGSTPGRLLDESQWTGLWVDLDRQ